jgi:protein arginine N-methyltransferase 2
MDKSYLLHNLTFTSDFIQDEEGGFVMIGHENPIMKQAAKDICKNGGRVLNVGFGMGIIDSYIQEYNVNEHWIIEGHPQVQQKILNEGWGNKKNVKLIFQPWQEVLTKLPKFDGIYFDTYGENQVQFHEYVHNILNPKGIYSFFNNPNTAAEEFNYPYLALQEIIKSPIDEYWEKGPLNPEVFFRFNIDFTSIEVNPTHIAYFNPNKKTYWHPILTFK